MLERAVCKQEADCKVFPFLTTWQQNFVVFVLLLVCWREVPNKSASTESPHLLNDLPSRDKGQHVMVTKILKENCQKYSKRLTKNMQRYSITSNRDYLKEQHMMVTKVLKGNTKNYLNILNDLSSWDNEQHRMLTSIFLEDWVRKD